MCNKIEIIELSESEKRFLWILKDKRYYNLLIHFEQNEIDIIGYELYKKGFVSFLYDKENRITYHYRLTKYGKKYLKFNPKLYSYDKEEKILKIYTDKRRFKIATILSIIAVLLSAILILFQKCDNKSGSRNNSSNNSYSKTQKTCFERVNFATQKNNIVKHISYSLCFYFFF